MEWDAAHERRLADAENRSRSNTHRLDDLEKRQDGLEDLVASVRVLAVRQETVEADVKEIKSDVKQLSGKSGARWDSTVDKIVWAVLAAMIAFVLSRIGL